MTPLLGAIADDFTGATDLANMLARSGMRTQLVFGRPAPDAPAPEAEAVVVALKSRTAPVVEAVDDSLASWRWLARAGAGQCYFKYCSTFDSTPRGNIGPVAGSLAEETGAEWVLYCPSFPEAGRTVYQGHLFVHDRPLAESGMQNHPLTPMTDSDLRRWLSPQLGGAGVGLVPFADVAAGPEAIRERIEAQRGQGFTHLIADAVTDANLEALGRACDGVPLVTGGSGLGLGLAANFAAAGLLAGGEADALPPVGGPILMLSGSCSGATNAQVNRWERTGRPLLRLDPVQIADAPDEALAGILAWVVEALPKEGAALISATMMPEQVAHVQAALGTAGAAHVVELTLARVAQEARAAGLRRFVVAGGETSGAVATALGIDRLAVGRQIAPGVPWCASLDAEPVALALKSGNFGGEHFFADAQESAP